MTIVGGLDIHRKQITFDYVDTDTGEIQRGQIAPADEDNQLKPDKPTLALTSRCR